MRAILLLIVLYVPFAGCASEEPTDAGHPPPPPPDDGPSLRFAIDSSGALPKPLDVPFPSDVYRDASGRLPATFGPWDQIGLGRRHETVDAALAGLDGFGRSVGAIFLLDGEADLDAATLVAGETYAIVDVDPASPERGTVVPSRAFYTSELRTLVVQPERRVLASGRRYAVVVTTGAGTDDGRALEAPPDLRDLLEAGPPAAAWSVYADAASVLVDSGFSVDRIASLAVFTTQTRHTLLHRAREALAAGAYGPVPELIFPSSRFPTARFGTRPHEGFTATLDEWLGDAPVDASGHDLPGFPSLGLEAGVGTAHDAIGAVLSATFHAPELRRPFAMTAAPDDGTLAIDPEGRPTLVDAENEVPVTIVLPRGPAPDGGFPVVLFGHGTPTHRSYVMSVANELARAGFATVSLDAPEHGMRAPGATDDRSSFTGPYRGPDAMADDISYLSSTVASFGGLVNLARARDTRFQTIVDYMALVRMVKSRALDLSSLAEEYGGIAPQLSPTFVGWVGVSFGGINGMVLAAVEPDIDSFVLDVGGGLEMVTFGESPANLPSLDLFLPLFGVASSHAVRMSRFHPVLTVLQMMLDSTDPGSFAYEATHPASGVGPDILMITVDHDELVPTYGSEVVAAEMGLPQIASSPLRVPGLAEIPAPVRADPSGATRALLVQAQGVHGRNLTSRTGQRTARTPFPREDMPIAERIVYLPEPVTVRQPIVATQRSMTEFLRSAYEGTATIDVSGMETWLDFDDDGFADDEEVSAGHDPFDPSDHPSGSPTHPRDVGF